MNAIDQNETAAPEIVPAAPAGDEQNRAPGKPGAAAKSRGRSRILRNVTSNWVGLINKIALSFFLAPFVVKGLGSVYYGIWTLLNEFTGYLWLFDFGVRESVIKYVAQYHAVGKYEELDRTVNASLFMYTGIALLTMVGTAGMSFALPYVFSIPGDSVAEARWTLMFTGAAIALGFIFNVFVGVLMGLQRFYLVSWTGVLFSYIRAALIVAALSYGYGIAALGAIQLFMTLLGGIVVIRVAVKSLPEYRPRLVTPSREDLSRVFAYAKYVVGNNIGEKVVFRTDAFVIGIFLPVAMLTYYAIAGSLVGYLRSMVMTMATVLNPASSALEARQDNERLKLLFLTACKSAVLIGLPVCLGLVILGERFIGLWMGPSYAHLAGQVLVVLATAHLFGLPHYCISSVLYGLGKHDIMARWRGVEAAANLTLSVALVLTVGLIGVALGTFFSHIFVAVGVLPVVMSRVMNIRLREYYLSTYGRPFLAAVPFAAACYFINTRLQPASLWSFFGLIILALPLYIVPSWFLALSNLDRATALDRFGRLLPRGQAGVWLRNVLTWQGSGS